MSAGERLVTVLSGILLGVALASLLLLALGWRPVVVLSRSMAPTAAPGDLLIARPVAPSDVVVGDVLTVPDAGAGRITHRVVGVETRDGQPQARLKGDANESPDPGRVPLGDGLLRTVLVVPLLGRLVVGDAPLLWGGLLAMGLGVAALRHRHGADARAPREDDDVSRASSDGADAAQAPPAAGAVDPRIVALGASLEALVEDGLPLATAAAVARVRTGAVLGLPHVESAVDSLALDDGARFVLIAHVDLDVAALRSVPLSSARSNAAREAVDRWWAQVGAEAPAAVLEELAPYLSAGPVTVP